MELLTRLKNAWSSFKNKDPTNGYSTGPGYYYRPDRGILRSSIDRSIVTSICNRIAIDVSSLDFRHVRLDNDGRFKEEINSPLNTCLSLEANIDQTGKGLVQDLVLSMLGEGVVAIVPIETDDDPKNSDFSGIFTLRAGRITEWYPEDIRVDLYNDVNGIHEEVVIPKRMAAIIENPLYSVMNDPNSMMSRLIRKLNLLDVIDEQTSSGKLDLIIQLPYVVKSSTRMSQAEERRTKIEDQLRNSKYGIAYIDGTEKITQLNRPVENNLMKQVEYLTNMAFAQIGMAQSVLEGSADEKTMLNYTNRIVEVIANRIADEYKRKFLSKTARTQGQSIMFFSNPFRFTSSTDFANISDTLTRNEIATSNEIRQVIGWRPSNDPKADILRNSNMPVEKTGSSQLKEVDASNDAGL